MSATTPAGRFDGVIAHMDLDDGRGRHILVILDDRHHLETRLIKAYRRGGEKVAPGAKDGARLRREESRGADAGAVVEAALPLAGVAPSVDPKASAAT